MVFKSYRRLPPLLQEVHGKAAFLSNRPDAGSFRGRPHCLAKDRGALETGHCQLCSVLCSLRASRPARTFFIGVPLQPKVFGATCGVRNKGLKVRIPIPAPVNFWLVTQVVLSGVGRGGNKLTSFRGNAPAKLPPVPFR